MNAPHEFPRRILLAVTGLSPQVVTETLYALTQVQAPAFVPTEIHLITTAQGAEHAKLELLSSDPGWFQRLRSDYRLPDIAFTADTIHVITDETGAALDDIRDPADNARAADQILACLRRLTQDGDAAVHVSIAGGRKTMGFYLGYALSLIGREQDRLSHVLVSTPFESNRQFYYPTPYERVIYTQDKQQRAVDCRKAVVTLAEIPFVRLRDGLPQRLVNGASTMSEVVAAANRAQQPARLVLNVRACTARVDDQEVPLGATEFAVLLWLATRVLGDDTEVDWTDAVGAREFLGAAREVMNAFTSDYERCERAVLDRIDDPKLLGEYFEPQKSRINKAFGEVLGSGAAARYAIARTGARGRSRYHLPLSQAQIEIVR